jgi:hypothetical protein
VPNVAFVFDHEHCSGSDARAESWVHCELIRLVQVHASEVRLIERPGLRRCFRLNPWLMPKEVRV